MLVKGPSGRLFSEQQERSHNTISLDVSKPWDMSLELYNRSEIKTPLSMTVAKAYVTFENHVMILKPNLMTSQLHKISLASLMRSRHLVYNTNYTTFWGMLFAAAECHITKTHLWCLPSVVKYPAIACLVWATSWYADLGFHYQLNLQLINDKVFVINIYIYAWPSPCGTNIFTFKCYKNHY